MSDISNEKQENNIIQIWLHKLLKLCTQTLYTQMVYFGVCLGCAMIDSLTFDRTFTMHCPGGPLVFQARYHPRKRTFKTHPKHVFFRYENTTLNTCFCLRFSLICPSFFFLKFVMWPKHTLFPILHVFAPLNDVRAYIAWSWKTTLITWVFLRGWYPTSNTSGPPSGCIGMCMHQVFCQLDEALH